MCRPGVAEADLDAAEQALGLPLPLGLRVLYRFLNGQVRCALPMRSYHDSASGGTALMTLSCSRMLPNIGGPFLLHCGL